MVIVASPAFRTRSVNPYQALLYENMESWGLTVIDYQPGVLWVQKCDILHFHWPEVQFLAPSSGLTVVKALRFFFILALARVQGTSVVWTAHNLRSHAQAHPRLEGLCWAWFRWQLAGVIYLSRSTRAEMERRYPGLVKIPGTTIPHGHYRKAYPPKVSRNQARKAMKWSEEEIVFGWVGQIGEYKGVPELISAWKSWEAADARLLVAGKILEEELTASLTEQCAGDSRITFRPGWVDVGKIRDFICASDVMVLPYREITNSGTALLALSYDVPVLLPRSPVMEELQAGIGDKWVHLYQGPISSRVLQNTREWLAGTERGETAPLDHLDWDRIATQTINFFRELRVDL